MTTAGTDCDARDASPAAADPTTQTGSARRTYETIKGYKGLVPPSSDRG